jgi:hypothetical protein
MQAAPFSSHKEKACGLTVCVTGGWDALILSTGRKNSTVEKCSKSRTVPTRPVHALLARSCYSHGLNPKVFSTTPSSTL